MKKHFKFNILLVLSGLFVSCQGEKTTPEPWVAMFDGESIASWKQLNGEALYSVRDGAIIGTTVSDTPNSFLYDGNTYSDFILEVDFKVDSTMNSGIQIRSNTNPNYRNGRVFGYQVEIDPSARAWSGGIYDEARRAWLHPLDHNEEAQKAFKQNDWNHYRIEAIADTIKTWVNGVPASHLIDEKDAEGIIAFQVHSIKKDQKAGTEKAWKNKKKITDSDQNYSTPSPLTPIVTKNQLTKREKDQGWQMLWDGTSTTGWRGAKLEAFPTQGWVIENGELTVLASGGGESEAGGDIVTEEQYTNFELSVDFKLTKGANSGIKYYVDTELNKGTGSAIGLEYQILDDAKHPDAKKGSHEGSRTLASLYDLIKADSIKSPNPIGEWNTALIKSNNGQVEHYLNGIKVLSYERGSEEYQTLVANSKYAKWPNFGEAERGPILLQDHGDLVSFKNIKIRKL